MVVNKEKREDLKLNCKLLNIFILSIFLFGLNKIKIVLELSNNIPTARDIPVNVYKLRDLSSK